MNAPKTAMVLAAGLEGIREGIDPGDPHRENLYNLSEAQRAEQGINFLPRSLGDALDAFEADPLSREVFSPSMFEAFLSYKRAEWEEYQNHVSEWERSRYLKFF